MNEFVKKADLLDAVTKAFSNDNPLSHTVISVFQEIVDNVPTSVDAQFIDTAQILKHLDSLCCCVSDAYNTSQGLLKTDMLFIEDQERCIKKLLSSHIEAKPHNYERGNDNETD